MIDDEWDDDDSEFDDFGDESHEAELLPCPACKTPIYEDAPQCPACGEYVVHDTSAWSGRSWWWILLGLVGIVAVIWQFSI